MHEILFKAKSKDADIWAEGDLVRDIDNFGEHRTCIYQSHGKGEWRKIFVDPETVCQYTGLHDNAKWEDLSEIEQRKFLSEWNFEKNRRNIKEDWKGRKIYEGDIVKQFADCNESGKSLYFFYKIRWNKEYCAFEGIEIYNNKETFLFPDLQDIEVIGNIFDNPELLKSEARHGKI